LGYDDLIQAAKDSLKRLQTDYLDLYLTHRYNPPSVPIEETMRAMNYLVDHGLVKNIGVSNYNVDQMKKAQSCSPAKLVANQLHLNLKFREAERKKCLKYCQENDMFFIAWRPLKGVFSDGIPEIVDKLSKKYKKTPVQIALNWLISQKNVVTLSKTTDIGHLKENLGSIGWEMEIGDVEMLRKHFPHQEYVSDVVPLA
jgi:diketogulonate reductase-like aldo/keto reductase